MTSETTISQAQLRTRARIAAHVLWDGMTDPQAVSATEVPWHPEAISANWITAVVARAAPDARALQVEVTGGDDGSSVRRRIEIQWNEAGKTARLPTQLFAKSTPTLATRLSAGMAAAAEGRFLLELRPSLAIEAPVCLYSARDADSGRSLHLLENLIATRSARFCNVETNIDREQAEQIIDTLAEIHGVFLQRGDVDELTWLGTYEDFFHAAGRSGIQDAHDRAMVRAADVIPLAVSKRRAEIWPAAVNALALHGNHQRTLLHSDVHLGNWYITSEGRMGLCDWARVCRGHWSRDLAYALMTTLSRENRQAWERDLIARYLEKLREKFGITIDHHDAWDAYRAQSFAALLMWTPTLCPPAMLPDMQPEAVSMTMIERIAGAIDDLDALDVFS